MAFGLTRAYRCTNGSARGQSDSAGPGGVVMTIHQCPKCELRFTWKTELDDHCANDHPQFKHEYPARKTEPAPRDPRVTGSAR